MGIIWKIPHFLYFREQAHRPVCDHPWQLCGCLLLCGHRTTRRAVVLYATAALLGTSLHRRGSASSSCVGKVAKSAESHGIRHIFHLNSWSAWPTPSECLRSNSLEFCVLSFTWIQKKGHNGAKIQDTSQDLAICTCLRRYRSHVNSFVANKRYPLVPSAPWLAGKSFAWWFFQLRINTHPLGSISQPCLMTPEATYFLKSSKKQRS